MAVAEDHAADRRLGLAVAALVAIEVALAFLADSNTIGLVVWLVLAVAAVLVVAAASAAVQRLAERPAEPPRS